MTRLSSVRLGCLGLCLALLIAGAQAQAPGVTDTQITIGSCSALDGPSRQLGLQMVLGASAYFAMVNEEQGGVNGRKLHLVPFDDSYDPEKAPVCFARLQKENVFAAGFFVGTPTAAKYVPLAENNKLPIVGLFTGAELLYKPTLAGSVLNHYVLNIRASYFDETREQVDNLWAIGVRKIAVIHPNDAFGAAVLDGVTAALKKHGAVPSAVASFKRETNQIEAAVESVRSTSPEAVVLVGPYAPVAAILKYSHSRRWTPVFLTVSFVGTDDLIKEAGEDAEGMVITQVVPPYYSTELSTVALYRKQLQKHFSNSAPGFVSLEGFVDAMVMVEGLKRAGRDLTREKFIHALESIHYTDPCSARTGCLEMGLGPKLKLNYGPTKHKGFDTVYSTVVRSGIAVPFTDWNQIRKK